MIKNKTIMNDKLKFYRETLVQMTKEAYRKMPNELKIEESVVEADLLTKAIMKQVDEFEQEKTNMWSPNYDPSYNMTTTIIDHLGFEGNKQNVNPDYLKTEPMRTIVDNGQQYSSYNKEELDYVCKLTQYDIDDIETRLNQVIKYYKDLKENYITEEQFNEFTERNINGVIGYLKDEGGIRKKDQIMQLLRQKAIKEQKSYGTLGEHWKELMDLFEMKNEAVDLKEYVEFYKESKKRGYNCYHAFQDSSICAEKRHKNDLTLKSIADSLGIEFIEDFVKACEKCEE